MGEPQINQKHSSVLKTHTHTQKKRENYEKTLLAKRGLLAVENAKI